MTTMTEFKNGVGRAVIREDAVSQHGRYVVPTSDKTEWVHDWAEFRAAGGQVCFEEDQTEITLKLPTPYKFSIGFYRHGEAS